MRREYKNWLHSQGYGDATIIAQLHRVGRVEEHYGDLDAHFERDGLGSLIEVLAYSTEDERRGRPNSTKIPFIGNVRNNLASYKSAVLWYKGFRESAATADLSAENGSIVPRPSASCKATPLLRQPVQLYSEPRVPARAALAPRVGPRTLVDFNLDGRAALEAIIEAAMTRLRPILMTSLAFGAGVLPLMFASGAGAGSEIAIGTSVVGGMASATVLTLAFVPFLYVLVRRAFPARRPKDDPLADLIRPEAAL